jgi:hypothetical protein
MLELCPIKPKYADHFRQSAQEECQQMPQMFHVYQKTAKKIQKRPNSLENA